MADIVGSEAVSAAARADRTPAGEGSAVQASWADLLDSDDAAWTGGSGTALLLMPAPVAHAEGSFSSYITQALPTFMSRTWSDHNLDSTATKVTPTGCRANAAGKTPGTTAVRSVTVQLWSASGQLASKKRTTRGTSDFGRKGVSTFWFVISEINGYTRPDRKVFLNVESVRVTY